VDLAAYSTIAPNFSVNFIGYRSDGSTLNTTFSGSGINFRTVNFSPAWSSGLMRVEIPNFAWSLDNLIVAVPEPNTCVLLATGTLGLVVWRIRKVK
ncbi:MAG: PEP-CTERM sorting domain-containing protein, partial [Verrucomicrobiota bacterium]|nr:PEP-CTERM sorting domain-containing protein [Verrucomicrobiota bacterium]